MDERWLWNLVFFSHLGPDIVIHHDRQVLEKMNDWSREQHTKSGLIQLIEQSQTSLSDAEDLVMDFLKKYCPFRTGVLAGNSVFVDRWYLPWDLFFNLHTIFDLGSLRNTCHDFMQCSIRDSSIVCKNLCDKT